MQLHYLINEVFNTAPIGNFCVIYATFSYKYPVWATFLYVFYIFLLCFSTEIYFVIAMNVSHCVHYVDLVWNKAWYVKPEMMLFIKFALFHGISICFIENSCTEG